MFTDIYMNMFTTCFIITYRNIFNHHIFHLALRAWWLIRVHLGFLAARRVHLEEDPVPGSAGGRSVELRGTLGGNSWNISNIKFYNYIVLHNMCSFIIIHFSMCSI